MPRARLLYLCAVISAAALLQGAQDAERPEMVVFHLFDVSGTFHTKAPGSPLVESTELLPNLVQTLSDSGLPTPQRHVVGLISAQSYQDPVCELSIAPTMFIPRTASTTERLKTCQRRVREQPVSPLTDISGALDFASRRLETTPARARKGLILFTDMVEERGASAAPPAPPRLDGVCVLVVYAYTSALVKAPARVPEYQAHWEKVLTEAGVRQIKFLLLSADLPAAAELFFRGCKRS